MGRLGTDWEKDDVKGNVISQALRKSIFAVILFEYGRKISRVYLLWSIPMKEGSCQRIRRLNYRKPISHTGTEICTRNKPLQRQWLSGVLSNHDVDMIDMLMCVWDSVFVIVSSHSKNPGVSLVRQRVQYFYCSKIAAWEKLLSHERQ